MFYHSPEVVRRGNGMEFNKNGLYRESKEESSLKVTLLGYKVMEEKTKFTVYKILVMHAPDQSWVIYRRYTDFSQVHDKLKEMFPEINFALPRKRWFNNFSAEFLEERKLGLQEFLQNLVVNKDVTNSEAVKDFLCLDKPPTEIDGFEDRWAFCETSCCLQKTFMDNKCEIETTRNLMHKELQISSPERTIIGTHRTQKWLNTQTSGPSANFHGEQETEVDNDDLKRPNKSSELTRSHGACWSGSATDSPLTNIKNT